MTWPSFSTGGRTETIAEMRAAGRSQLASGVAKLRSKGLIGDIAIGNGIQRMGYGALEGHWVFF